MVVSPHKGHVVSERTCLNWQKLTLFRLKSQELPLYYGHDLTLEPKRMIMVSNKGIHYD